jgi:hypothetical protein
LNSTSREAASSSPPQPQPPKQAANGHAGSGNGSAAGRPGLSSAEIAAGFEEWWRHYPRKVDKKDAYRAYLGCVANRDPDWRATIPQLLAAVKAHRFPTDLKFVKHPATWLNKGSWKDEAAAKPFQPSRW